MVPRGLHEAVWALILLSVLGRNPLVVVLGIGIPFGAITAKVVAEMIDDAGAAPFLALRAAGATRPAALAYGVLPSWRVSSCRMRSTASSAPCAARWRSG